MHGLPREVPAFAQALVDAFWPGPLTLILPRLDGVATVATGGQDSVGLRCPAHPVAHAVLQACAAPACRLNWAARPWGWPRPAPTALAASAPPPPSMCRRNWADLLVLDGGPCGVGIESTIVDCTRGVPVLLRPAPSRARRSRRPAASNRYQRRAASADPTRLRHAGGPLRPNARCA